MLNRLLWEELLNLLLSPEEFKRRLDNAIEQEGEINQQNKPDDLQPLERFPAQTEGDDPDEEGPAGIDSRAGGSTHCPSDGETKKVETT